MGLSSEEFYELQPRQMDALVKRWQFAKNERELLFAQQAALTVNYSMMRGEKAARIVDFMPSRWKRAKSAPINRKHVVTQIRGMMDALMKRGGNG